MRQPGSYSCYCLTHLLLLPAPATPSSLLPLPAPPASPSSLLLLWCPLFPKPLAKPALLGKERVLDPTVLTSRVSPVPRAAPSRLSSSKSWIASLPWSLSWSDPLISLPLKQPCQQPVPAASSPWMWLCGSTVQNVLAGSHLLPAHSHSVLPQDPGSFYAAFIAQLQCTVSGMPVPVPALELRCASWAHLSCLPCSFTSFFFFFLLEFSAWLTDLAKSIQSFLLPAVPVLLPPAHPAQRRATLSEGKYVPPGFSLVFLSFLPAW